MKAISPLKLTPSFPPDIKFLVAGIVVPGQLVEQGGGDTMMEGRSLVILLLHLPLLLAATIKGNASDNVHHDDNDNGDGGNVDGNDDVIDNGCQCLVV